MSTKELDKQYIAGTYARFDLELVRGKGSVAYDAEGKAYIDLGSGIAVNSFGFCDDAWQAAVKAQVEQLNHTSNLYFTAPQAQLAQLLCQKTGMQKVFFSNSGAEANECAIKVARKYAHDRYGEGRSKIITLQNSFHGRTITTLTATGQDSFHKDFGPFTEGFVYLPANDLEAADREMDSSCAAIMMELVQGEGGVNPLDISFVRGVCTLAAQRDILVIIDEVQTGNGRTGSLYAYSQFGITPDIVSTAKGLAGGLPLGATLLGAKTAGVLSAGDHGSTFGGNPICAAAALNVLQRIDDKLLQEVQHKSKLVLDALSHAKGVKSVTGMGLMLGIEVQGDAKKMAAAALQKGVLVLTAKQKLRLLPALNIPEDVLQQGLEILKEVIADGTLA